jgi:phosphatidylglycerol---prolipoprotein diacylglyceryl transferase
MRPILFQIGDFKLYSFGLMTALSLILPGLLIAGPLVRRRGAGREFIYELIAAAAAGGIAGARIYYMIENWSLIRGDFWGALFGGIGFVWYGGLIGGFLAAMIVTRIRRVPLGVLANAAAPSLAVGYAIGRVGCQLAGDGDYGKISGLPWAMGYPNGTVPTLPGVRVHPTPIYEILAMIPIAWVLWRLAGKDRSGWWTFGWFLILSGVERILVEFVRRNAVWFAGLTQPQWVAIAGALLGIGLVLRFGKQPAERVRA